MEGFEGRSTGATQYRALSRLLPAAGLYRLLSQVCLFSQLRYRGYLAVTLLFQGSLYPGGVVYRGCWIYSPLSPKERRTPLTHFSTTKNIRSRFHRVKRASLNYSGATILGRDTLTSDAPALAGKVA